MKRCPKIILFCLFLGMLLGISARAFAECSMTGTGFSAEEMKTLETHIFSLKNRNAEDVCGSLLLFRADIVSNRSLRTLSVKAPKETMAVIEEAIARLDIPAPVPAAPAPSPYRSRNMEMTVFVLGASDD